MIKQINFGNHKLGLVLLGAFALLFTACNKEEENPEDIIDAQQVQLVAETAEDDALATEEFSSVFEFVMDEAPYMEDSAKGGSNSENMPGCATVTFEQAIRTLTIDFGSEGCMGNDGIMRSGMIIAVFSGTVGEPGASVSVSLQDYTVEGFAIAGNKTITNTTEEVGMESFSVVVSDASITGPNGLTRSWSSQYQVKRIAGADTPRPYDNVYETTGSAAGVDRNGNNFTRTITVPLIKDRRLGCLRNYVAGEVVITNDRFESDLVVNFGDGACDRRATVTYNGNTRVIFLR